MFKTAGKEKPKAKCPELEDDDFEALREELQAFKTNLKLINTELPTFKSNVKNICAPLEDLNTDVVELYDWNVSFCFS